MRYVRIDRVSPGDVLAKDIIDSRGQVLLRASSDMVLKEHILNRLKEKGVKGVYITDEISKDVVIEDTIPLSVRNLTTQALEKKNVQETQLLANEIVNTFKYDAEIDLNRMMGEVTYYERALNICELCLSLGKHLNMSNDSLNKLVTSALLSDIALIMSEDEKNKLLNTEIERLKNLLLSLPISETYPILGRYLVSQGHADPMVIHAVYFHKENEDGTGIVQDLFKKMGINRNYDIRDTAKIIHICSDYIDSLIKENDFSKARNTIEQGVIDKKYNYELAFTFLRFIPIYPIGTIVNLSNGERAIVVKNNEGSPLSPVVHLETGEEIDLTKTLNVVINGIEDLQKGAIQK